VDEAHPARVEGAPPSLRPQAQHRLEGLGSEGLRLTGFPGGLVGDHRRRSLYQGWRGRCCRACRTLDWCCSRDSSARMPIPRRMELLVFDFDVHRESIYRLVSPNLLKSVFDFHRRCSWSSYSCARALQCTSSQCPPSWHQGIHPLPSYHPQRRHGRIHRRLCCCQARQLQDREGL
jgi:hypothetical protein